MSTDLLALAIQAQTDRDAITVLADAVLEQGWYHPLVMPLCLGVPVDDKAPRHLRTREALRRQGDPPAK